MTQQGPSVWYLGIGSMMSLSALRTRGVYPSQSRWCEILGYRRVHYPHVGMATLVPEIGATAHALAHEITQAEMVILEGREPPSHQVRARLRGSTENVTIDGLVSLAKFVELRGVCWQSERAISADNFVGVLQESSGARAYIVAASKEGITVIIHQQATFDRIGVVTTLDETALGVPTEVLPGVPISAPPSARYLDLMLEGARAVGMDESVIAAFASTPCVPRKAVAELRRLPLDPAVASCYFSEAELRAQQELFAVFRGRVLRLPDSGQSLFWRPALAEHEPLDASLRTAKQFYDPMHGAPPDDPHQPWAGWPYIEDWAAGTYQNWRHVGWLAPSDAVKTASRL